MPFAEHFMIQGVTLASQTETLPATIKVNCGFLPTKVELTNETEYGVTNTGDLNIQTVEWDSVYPNNTKLTYINAAGDALMPGVLTTNGISQYNGGGASPNQMAFGPAIAGTTYNKGTATFTITSTASLYAGATVLLTGFTVDKQLGGVLATVATVASSTTFTLSNAGWLNTANFTAGSQTFAVRLVTVGPLFYPQNAQIAAISAANPAVVTTTTNTNLTVGQQVRLYVPSVFGMVQANNKMAIISAVSGNQVTLGGFISLDSSAYTAFAWPAATSVPFTGAWLVPVGSGPSPQSGPPISYNVDVLDDATTSQAYQGFVIGSGILQTSTNAVIGSTAEDIYSWTAWRGDL